MISRNSHHLETPHGPVEGKAVNEEDRVAVALAIYSDDRPIHRILQASVAGNCRPDAEVLAQAVRHWNRAAVGIDADRHDLRTGYQLAVGLPPDHLLHRHAR